MDTDVTTTFEVGTGGGGGGKRRPGAANGEVLGLYHCVGDSSLVLAGGHSEWR